MITSMRELPGADGRPLFHSLLSLDLTKLVGDYYEWNIHYGAPEVLDQILDPLWKEGVYPERFVFYHGALMEQKAGDPEGRVRELRREIRMIKMAEEFTRTKLKDGKGSRTWFDMYQGPDGILRDLNFHSHYWEMKDGFKAYMPRAAYHDPAAGLDNPRMSQNHLDNEILAWKGHVLYGIPTSILHGKLSGLRAAFAEAVRVSIAIKVIGQEEETYQYQLRIERAQEREAEEKRLHAEKQARKLARHRAWLRARLDDGTLFTDDSLAVVGYSTVQYTVPPEAEVVEDGSFGIPTEHPTPLCKFDGVDAFPRCKDCYPRISHFSS